MLESLPLNPPLSYGLYTTKSEKTRSGCRRLGLGTLERPTPRGDAEHRHERRDGVAFPGHPDAARRKDLSAIPPGVRHTQCARKLSRGH